MSLTVAGLAGDALELEDGDLRAAEQLHHRQISEEQIRKFEGYMAEIFTAFGLDLKAPATEDTPRRFIRAFMDVTAGYDSDPKLVKAFSAGVRRLRGLRLPSSVQILQGENADRLSARSILAGVARVRSSNLILIEGGPHLLGDFPAEQYLDEQFLTLSPQIAGRNGSPRRPGLVAGKRFAPEHPLWGTLLGVKRSESHLFLRYAFDSSV